MNRIFTIGFLIVSAIFWMANADGRASSQNAGNTGAPGDEVLAGVPRTCQTCHSTSSEVTTSMSLSIQDDNGDEVSMYIPGQVYRVKISHAAAGAPAEYGFQMVALVDSDESDVAGFSNPSTNTQIAQANSRQYIEQNGPSTESFFEADWTAPAQGSGNITFYFSGNAVDGNNMNSGDGADTGSATIEESTTSDLSQTHFQDLSIFPNPSDGLFNVSGLGDENASYEIFNLLGSKIKSNASLNQAVDLSELSNGVYLIRIYSEKQNITRKIQISR